MFMVFTFTFNCKMMVTTRFSIFLIIHLLLLYQRGAAQNDFHGEERDALLALVSGFNNPFFHDNWTSIMCFENNPPRWFGIGCTNGRVTSVRLENMNLGGEIRVDVLTNLTQLSTFSLKNNSISGQLMDFSHNPKLTEIDLSGNRFGGEIPLSIVKLNSLASLQLQQNSLNGSIPPFDQPSLKELNFSHNNLSGPIPNTKLLQSSPPSAFIGNQNLCGPPSSTACKVISKNAATKDSNNESENLPPSEKKSKLSPILIAANVVAIVFLFLLFIVYLFKYKKLKKRIDNKAGSNHHEEKGSDEKLHVEARGKRVGNAEEGVQNGKLVFLNGEKQFELDDLLKASAEGLGKGNFGNCYKAMLGNGPTVVVKRLRDLKPLTSDEFFKQVRSIAEQKHSNLLPIVAYYYSKEEKLLIYNFASTGNAHNRLHEGKGKPSRVPFRWSSRLMVARGVGRALEHLHVSAKSSNTAPHGNLKLSNVLLDENDGVLVTDYGLTTLVAAPLAAQRMMSYKSPEFQSSKRISRKSDVWSYGCLLLELVTGRMSADSAPAGTSAVDLCSWVNRAVREEWTAEIFDVEIAVQRSANHGMLKLLQIAMRCCERLPENRPEMSAVVREVESIAVTVDSEDDEDLSSMDPSLTDESMSTTPARIVME